ncbi:MAG: FtsQ-type POTRA domain-containing protein [Gemmatimonadota bacterium]
MTRRRRGLLVSLAVAVIASAVLFAPRLMRRSSFFRVHEIEVVGLRYLDQAEVARRLHLAADASVMDPLERVRAAALAIPGVVAAAVDRRYPATLRVVLLEATPVALAAQADRMVLLDSRGRVLPFDPVRAPTSLPLAEPDSAATAVLTRVMLSDSSWFAAIDRAHRDGSDIILDEGGHQVRVRSGANAATLRAVTAVRAYLGRRSVAWREIDARYQGRVFVRKGTA